MVFPSRVNGDVHGDVQAHEAHDILHNLYIYINVDLFISVKRVAFVSLLTGSAVYLIIHGLGNNRLSYIPYRIGVDYVVLGIAADRCRNFEDESLSRRTNSSPCKLWSPLRYLEQPSFRHFAACVPPPSNGTLLTVAAVFGLNSVIVDIAIDFVEDDVLEHWQKVVLSFEVDPVSLKSGKPIRHPDPPRWPYDLVFQLAALRFLSAQAVTVLHRRVGNRLLFVRTQVTLFRC